MAERSTVPSPAMSVRQLRNVLIALSDVLGGGGGSCSGADWQYPELAAVITES